MGRSRTLRRVVSSFAVAIFFLAAAVGSPSRADLTPWDQEAVTGLAKELASAVKEARSAFRSRSPTTIGAGDQLRKQFGEALKGLESSTRQLVSRLEKGADREGTASIAAKIRTRVRDAREYGRKTLQTEELTTLYGPVNDLLDRIEPYYFESSP